MTFTSAPFLVFFSLAVFAYWAIPRRLRAVFLLSVSYGFYASFHPVFLPLIVFSTVAAWGAGLWIGGRGERRAKKARLAAGIAVALVPLLFFKYFNFVNDSLRALAGRPSGSWTVPHMDMLLPVGISFYTFRIVSYLVDVYREACAPEKRMHTLALHVAFFPQLIAGPIERAPNLLPQLSEGKGFDYDFAIGGMRLMLWGGFKKLVIADRCAILVNQVYDNPASYAGYPLALAAYLFAFQIYCDFSGYTDMARGMARILGLRSMENFRRPYFSRSLGEFWRRWHISLSSWFRDYLYIPMGGSRVSASRHYANLLVVFMVSGLWHGAGWTFVAWGAFHGACLAASSLFSPLGKKVSRTLGIDGVPAVKNAVGAVVTFHLVLAGWVLFRVRDIRDAWYVFVNMFGAAKLPVTEVPLGLPPYQIAVAAVAIAVMMMVEALQERGVAWDLWRRRPLAVRWTVYAALVFACINLQAPVKSAFIYMQF